MNWTFFVLMHFLYLQEEYMNLDTLEGRLHVLIKRLPQSNHNQQYPQLVNGSSPSISTMIPTPGMPQNGNSNLMVPSSSVDTAMIASTNSNTGSMLPTAGATFVGIHGGSFNSSDGNITYLRMGCVTIGLDFNFLKLKCIFK